MSNSHFKYKTRFNSFVNTVYASNQDLSISTASLEKIKALAPDGAHIKDNFDLLYNVFNAAVINRINKNHDGIDAATAARIYKKFIHKPQNIEHNRQKVVGHIINAGFSTFPKNEIIDEEKASGLIEPFYLNLSAVVYKLVDPELCSLLIDAADETSPHYNSICTSWELGFNEYDILLGHKDISEGERVTDPKQVEAFSKYLKMYGGSGELEDKTPVYRLIKGDVLPLGCGYTTMPAAEVEGVAVVSVKEDDEAKASEQREVIDIFNTLEKADTAFKVSSADLNEAIEQVTDNAIILSKLSGLNEESAVETLIAAINSFNLEPQTLFSEEKLQKIIKDKNISSQEKDNNVKGYDIMRLEDITDDKLSQISAANVRAFLAEEIEKASNEFAEKLDAEKEKAKASEEKATEVASELEKVSKQLEAVKAELESEKEIRLKEKAQADFNSRMAEIDSNYNLTDKDREIVIKSIKGLSDDAYAEWSADFAILAEHKKKDFQKDESKASVEDALDKGKVEDIKLGANTQDSKDNQSEWAEAFKTEDIVVSK